MNKEYILTTILGNGETLKPVMRKTEKGVSNYVNKMFRKYGESVTVEVGFFDNSLNWIPYCTYHAQAFLKL